MGHTTLFLLPSFLHMLTDNRPNSLNFLYFMNNSCHVMIGSFVILPIVWVLTFKKLKHLQHASINEYIQDQEKFKKAAQGQ